jgi:glycosyltransferase involved in cell wall biosynthesis
MRIVLAHDSFTQLGGAERVVEAMHEMFPDAPIFTLVLDRRLKEKYKDWDTRTSWIQVLYNFIPKLQYLLPFIPMAVYSIKFDDYDVVLSSSSSWIKNIHVPKNCVHINYCHTPTRFLWTDADYFNQEVPKFLRPIAKPIINLMKKWDYKGAQRVTRFIANSKEVQNRIRQYYNRDSEVIYPFVDTDFWKPVSSHCEEVQSNGVSPVMSSRPSAAESRDPEPGPDWIPDSPSGALRASGMTDKTHKLDYFLIAGRLQAHKHNDLIIEIFNELGLPLHIVGVGRQQKYLQSIAKSNIKFLGRIPDEQLREEYSGALGVICPQLEDFGLIPLEAAACGTATLGLAKGGNLETVVPGVTGELFGQDVVAPFMEPLEPDKSGNYNQVIKDQIKKLILSWNPQKYTIDNLRHQAEKFGKGKFKQRILEMIDIYK